MHNGVPTIEEDFSDPEPDSSVGLVPKRVRLAVSFRADETDNWGEKIMPLFKVHFKTFKTTSVSLSEISPQLLGVC